MIRLPLIRTLALGLLLLPGALRGQLAPPPATQAAVESRAWVITNLTGNGWVEYTLDTRQAVATNGVLVQYGGAILTADSISANLETGEVVADGMVRIEREDQIWAGDHIRYNFNTHQMEAAQFRTGKNPVFAGGHDLHGDTNLFYVATNAFVTTDDVAEPVVTNAFVAT